MKRYILGTLTAALAIVGCGGGGGETVAGIDARGNLPPTAVASQGAITGFGSVVVNGVRYDTSSAMFTIDGASGSQADLAVGDVVTVLGTVNSDGTSPTAASVSFDDAVEGPISAIDTVAQTLTVLGQLVRVDAETSFDDSINPQGLDGLNVADVVEVSGFFLADGSISATRIEPKAAGGELELTGIVSNQAGTTFEINGFVVDFGAATPVGFPGGSPEDGQRVEAKGDGLGGAGQLIATRVEYKGTGLGDDGDHVELEGFVTRFLSLTDFDVEGLPVTTNGQTVYENGAGGDVALNRKLEVEGELNAAGVLVATKVEIKASGFIRVEALVEDVQANQLTVLGIVFGVNELTRFEDNSDADLEIFNLSHVVVGNFVEIRAFQGAGGLVATRLDRDDVTDEVALRGFVDSVNDPQFTILGVVSTTGASTTYSDRSGTPMSSGEFFAQANGRLVEVTGTLNGGSIDAAEVEFEN
jgi:hypothetical protein